MIALSLDVDWAEQEVLDYALALVRRCGLKCTVFATHPCGLPASADIEVAIHPNPASLAEAQEKTEALLAVYPQARGIRNHGLFSSFYLYEAYRRLGLVYESNHLCFGQRGLGCYYMPGRIVQAPICFMDDVHLRLKAEGLLSGWSPGEREWLRDGSLKVFDFHPVHLYLNTASLRHYEEAKAHYHQPARLRALRRQGPGIETLFVELADLIAAEGLPTCTLSEACALFQAGQGGAAATAQAAGVR